jgi:hypothetical protein
MSGLRKSVDMSLRKSIISGNPVLRVRFVLGLGPWFACDCFLVDVVQELLPPEAPFSGDGDGQFFIELVTHAVDRLDARWIFNGTNTYTNEQTPSHLPWQKMRILPDDSQDIFDSFHQSWRWSGRIQFYKFFHFLYDSIHNIVSFTENIMTAIRQTDYFGMSRLNLAQEGMHSVIAHIIFMRRLKNQTSAVILCAVYTRNVRMSVREYMRVQVTNWLQRKSSSKEMNETKGQLRRGRPKMKASTKKS